MLIPISFGSFFIILFYLLLTVHGTSSQELLSHRWCFPESLLVFHNFFPGISPFYLYQVAAAPRASRSGRRV